MDGLPHRSWFDVRVQSPSEQIRSCPARMGVALRRKPLNSRGSDREREPSRWCVKDAGTRARRGPAAHRKRHSAAAVNLAISMMRLLKSNLGFSAREMCLEPVHRALGAA